MRVEDIKSVINLAEEKYKVNEWVIDGVYIWPLIRISNYAILCGSLMSNKKIKEYKRYFEIILTLLQRVKVYFADNKKEGTLKKSDVILIGDGVSKTLIKGTWYDKFCDPIVDFLKENQINYVALEVGREMLYPRYNDSIFIQHDLDFKIIFSKFISFFYRNKSINLDGYSDFLKDDTIKNYFSYLPSVKELQTRVIKIKSLEQFYLKRLNIVKPKVGFIVSYYYDAGFAFNMACKKNNIKSIDLQHGVQGPYHLAYCNWRKMPEFGFNQLPDFFWVWSDHEKESIKNTNQSVLSHRPIVTSNLFLKLWFKNNHLDYIKYYDKKFIDIFNNKKKNILLTLSPNTDKSMESIYQAFLKLQYDYNIYIRLHPNMLNEMNSISEYYESISFIHYDIKQSSILPLYSLLRNVDIHITVQSSTVIEAYEFGISSIVTSEYGATLYQEYIKAGDVVYCDNSSTILDNINSLILKNRKAKISDSDVYSLDQFRNDFLN